MVRRLTALARFPVSSFFPPQRRWRTSGWCPLRRSARTRRGAPRPPSRTRTGRRAPLEHPHTHLPERRRLPHSLPAKPALRARASSRAEVKSCPRMSAGVRGAVRAPRRAAGGAAPEARAGAGEDGVQRAVSGGRAGWGEGAAGRGRLAVLWPGAAALLGEEQEAALQLRVVVVSSKQQQNAMMSMMRPAPSRSHPPPAAVAPLCAGCCARPQLRVSRRRAPSGKGSSGTWRTVLQVGPTARLYPGPTARIYGYIR